MAGSGMRMPAHLIERAKSLVTGGAWEVPLAKDAATVVMVCDADDGLHVYLQRRVRTMRFAPGMYVFPGGRVDDADRVQARALIDAEPEPFAASVLALPDDQSTGHDSLAARLAAVREVQEETSHHLDDPMELQYIAHWVTPVVEDRRYDTRFYAVDLPAENLVIENSGESDAERWIRPKDALAEYGSGLMAMLPPTVAVLAAFAEADAQGLRAATAIASLAAKPIVPFLPSPVADPSAQSGIRWAIVDVRTGDELFSFATPPAGSESGGIHTSLDADAPG